MKKKICMLLAALSLTLSLLFSMNVQASDTVEDDISATSSEISPRAYGYAWKYKIVDGVLYKRLYNYTFGVWIGDWIKA